MSQEGSDEAIFWRLWAKYGQPSLARHPRWDKLENPEVLKALREGMWGPTLCELDLQFLSEIGLPEPDDWLWLSRFSAGTFYGTSAHRGTLLGHHAVSPLLLSKLEGEVVLVKPESREVFYHARCVAHAVLLPLMFEGTARQIAPARDASQQDPNPLILQLLKALEEDLLLLDSKLLSERCFWSYELFSLSVDYNPNPPVYFPEGENDELPF